MCPEQLHRASECCNKEHGTGEAGSSDRQWPSTEGRIWEPQTCSAPIHSGGAQGPSTAPRKLQRQHRLAAQKLCHRDSLKAKIAGLFPLFFFFLYYNCYYLQGPQQRKHAGRAVPLQHKAVPNNPLRLLACTMK